MNDYLEYMNTLSSVIADRNEEIASAQRDYASKLPGIEETKSIIETATGLPSSIFLEKGLGNFILKKEGRAYLQKTAKNIFDKGRQFYNDNLSRNVAERRAAGGTQVEEPREVEFRNPLYEGPEPAPQIREVEFRNPLYEGPQPEDAPQTVQTATPEGASESGANLQDQSTIEEPNVDFGEPRLIDAGQEAIDYLDSLSPEEYSLQMLEAVAYQNQQRFKAAQQLAEPPEGSDLPVNPDLPDIAGFTETPRDSLAPMRDLMQRSPQGQENGGVRPEQTTESGTGDASADASANPEAGSVGTSEDVSSAIESGETSGGVEAGAEAGTEAVAEGTGEAVAEGIGAALDFDPFTALIGLFVGIGGLIGGIEGADSIKNPPAPKLPTQELVSVVKGAGGF